MVKKKIEAFLLDKQGYLKKSPLKVAKAIWKLSTRESLPHTREELQKELTQIKEVQTNMRTAKSIKNTVEEDFLMTAYHKILAERDRPKKRLFFDIEVSANIVFSWRIGRDVNLSPDDIIQERAIICVCYKWEGSDTVHSIEWKKGDDKELLQKFAKVIDGADEVLTQNGDSFDIKWLRTRCIYHGIPVSPKFNSIDTLKMARAGFKFNSNKLNYMGKFLGVGEKIRTEYDLWKNITLHNCRKSMNMMVDYCKQDVVLLEEVYQKLQKFSPVKKFKYKI